MHAPPSASRPKYFFIFIHLSYSEKFHVTYAPQIGCVIKRCDVALSKCEWTPNSESERMGSWKLRRDESVDPSCTSEATPSHQNSNNLLKNSNGEATLCEFSNHQDLTS